MTVGSSLNSLKDRAAAPADAPAIASTLNEGIRWRAAYFGTMERTPEDVLAWFTPTGAGTVPHPSLAAEIDGSVLGWVRAVLYRPR